MAVKLLPICLGDRRLTARGWLIIAYGAVRGIIAERPDGCIHYGYACDRRLQPDDGYMVFPNLEDASKWFTDRLTN
jgi:hypothetical protein